MRVFYMFLWVFALSIFSNPASADTRSYCEVFGKDFANQKTNDVDTWLITYRNAFGDCMTQYTADAKVEPLAKKVVARDVRKHAQKVVIAPANSFSRKKRTPILEPGSNAWNESCAAKYASFNKATGYYKSRTGKERRCEA